MDIAAFRRLGEIAGHGTKGLGVAPFLLEPLRDRAQGVVKYCITMRLIGRGMPR